MTRFLNEFDLDVARQRYAGQPYRLALVATVDALRQWADANSDGWAYWKLPLRAAEKAMEIIEGDGTNAAFSRPDVTLEEAQAAIMPIRSFLLLYNVAPATMIDPLLYPMPT